MFRSLVNPNLTSLYKPLVPVFREIARNLSNCPECYPPKRIQKVSLSAHSKFKVTVCGAKGQLGSIISFLLKQAPLVDVLSLYDLDSTYGMAMDLAHIDTKCRVQSFSGCKDLYECMRDSNVVIICAGVGRHPGMSLNDLFEYNAPVVKQIAEAIATVRPEALVAVLTNPINSFVPMVSQIFKNLRVYDPRKIFGVTTIDNMRASSIIASDVFLGEADPAEFLVPVIGGHSPETIVPVLSQTSPCTEIPSTSYDFLIQKIRCAASLVMNYKPRGGPRLSVALGAARFTNNLLRGLRNERDVVDLAYVRTSHVPGVSYFASPIELGPSGIKQNLGLLKVDENSERPYLDEAIRYLKCEIKRGEHYVSSGPKFTRS